MSALQGSVIGKGEALAILRQARGEGEPTVGKATSGPDPSINPVSEAARTLGQRGAEARAANKAAQGQVPVTKDKLARPETSAPQGEDKPDGEAQDNSEGREAEEPEGQDAEQEQPQEGAESGEDDGQEPIIEIDGEKLTAQEIRDSYLRREDYSRKTAEVASARKQVDTVLASVTQNSQRIEQLVGLLEQAVGQEPDWGNLALTMEPHQYLAYKENWNAQKQTLNNVRTEQAKAVESSLLRAKQAMFDEAAQTFRPEWRDEVKRQEGVSKLADFAVSMGVYPEELKFLHRTPMLRILDMAAELHAMKTTQRITDKRVRTKPKPVRPGSQQPRTSAADAELQTERQAWESNKRPSVKDSQRWIAAKRNYEAATGKRA